MNDRDERFERDLNGVLRGIAGEEAPMSLRYRLSDITERAPIGRQSWFITPMRLSLVVAGLAVLALALLLWPRADVGPGPSESPSLSQSMEPSATAEPTPTLVPSGEQPTTAPTVAPTPVPTTGPTGDWTGLVWSDPVTPSFTVHLYDLVPWGDGYVAVGANGTLDEAMFLTSPDGLNWTVTYRTDPGSGRIPWYLEASNGALFAFSNPDMDFPVDGIVPSAPPLVWRSTDGSRWDLVNSASWQAAWEDGWMFAGVESGRDGLVAIGNHLAGDYNQSLADPVVLHSVDGVEWVETSVEGLGPHSIVSDVVAFGDAYALLGGTEDSIVTGTGMPQAWYSGDGVNWIVAPVAGATDRDFQFDGQAAHAGAAGLVSRSQQQCAGCIDAPPAWVSTDGRSWERDTAVGADVPAFGLWGSDGSRIIVLSAGERRAMVLPPPSEPAPGLTIARMSLDGLNWTDLTLSHEMTDTPERFWVVPDGVIYAGEQSFWFGRPNFGP